MGLAVVIGKTDTVHYFVYVPIRHCVWIWKAFVGEQLRVFPVPLLLDGLQTARRSISKIDAFVTWASVGGSKPHKCDRCLRKRPRVAVCVLLMN